jgi:hypothetical protein
MTKMYLGNLLGLGENESSKLLISSEIGSILNNFLFHGAPVKTIDKLLGFINYHKKPLPGGTGSAYVQSE